MKKLMLSLIALAALPGSVLFAQNPTGTWQGTLKTGRQDLRVVFKISLEDDKLKATNYSIDQGGQPIPVSTISQDGSIIKMTVSAIGGSFEGRLSTDGKSIAGTWTQSAPLPLTLVRATPEATWAIPDPLPPPVRMAATANPEFEVATIKPSDPARRGKLFTVRGADVLTVNTTVSDILTMAYDLHPRQLIGAPGWIESEKYDITGRPDVPGQPSSAQLKIMLQKLLADRLQLKFHRETRELSVYAITVAKTGAKITKSTRDPDSLPGLFFRGPGTSLNVTNATLAEVANILQAAVLDKPVVNQTGLSGKYDFILKWTPDQTQFVPFGGPPPAAPDATEAPPDLFAAIQQQLGLKLESTKAPADVLVIDRLERPSAN